LVPFIAHTLYTPPPGDSHNTQHLTWNRRGTATFIFSPSHMLYIASVVTLYFAFLFTFLHLAAHSIRLACPTPSAVAAVHHAIYLIGAATTYHTCSSSGVSWTHSLLPPPPTPPFRAFTWLAVPTLASRLPKLWALPPVSVVAFTYHAFSVASSPALRLPCLPPPFLSTWDNSLLLQGYISRHLSYPVRGWHFTLSDSTVNTRLSLQGFPCTHLYLLCTVWCGTFTAGGRYHSV